MTIKSVGHDLLSLVAKRNRRTSLRRRRVSGRPANAGQRIQDGVAQLGAETLGRIISDHPAGSKRRFSRFEQAIHDSVGNFISTNWSHLQDEAVQEAATLTRSMRQSYTSRIGRGLMQSLSRSQIADLVPNILSKGVPVSRMFDNMGRSMAEEIASLVRTGITTEETPEETARRVRSLFQRSEGRNPKFPEWSKTISQTMVQATSNHAMLHMYEQSEYLAYLQWISTFDLRTTQTCAVRAGKLYDLRTKRPIGHRNPWNGGPGAIHIRCRSVSIAIPREDAPGLNEGVRQALREPTPEFLFMDWLESASEADQRAYLGKRDFELFKTGKYQESDLIRAINR